MAEPEILFDIDAAKILGKLHLAGLQATKYDKNTLFVVNTGIVNDNPQAKPENPGKVEFDLGNAQGQYEIGFVTEAKFKNSNGANTVIDLLKKYQADINTQAKKDQKAKDKSLTDKNIEDTDNAKIVDDMFKKVIDTNKDTLDKIDKDFITNFDKDFFAGRTDGITKHEDLKAVTSEELKKYVDQLIDVLTKKNEEFKKTSGEAKNGKGNEYSKERSEALKQLQNYMTVFVGPEKAKALTDDSLVMIYVSDKAKGPDDKTLVQHYKIMKATDQEIETQLKKNEADPKNAKARLCFKFGYSVKIDK